MTTATHTPGCPATRAEVTHHGDTTATRCVDCGMQTTTDANGTLIPDPITPTITGAHATEKVGTAFRDILWGAPTHYPTQAVTRAWNNLTKGNR